MDTHNREVIVLLEHDDWFHGVVLGPLYLPMETCQQFIDEVFDKVKKRDDWNYDDVFAELEARGFIRLEAHSYYE